MKGIDVSYHQGVIAWEKVKASGIEFAIIRAGYGKNVMDKQFVNNISDAISAGLKIGIYWFIYASGIADAELNAKRFHEVIKPYKNAIELNIWADWEYDSDKRNQQTKEGRTAIVKTFLQNMKEKGYDVGVYTNQDYLENMFGDLTEYPLWLAKYSTDMGRHKPYIWQYSSKGSVPGINGNVDMNILYEENAPIDNDFDKNTERAVKEFQSKNGLAVDGIVGPKTRLVLNDIENG